MLSAEGDNPAPVFTNLLLCKAIDVARAILCAVVHRAIRRGESIAIQSLRGRAGIVALSGSEHRSPCE